MFEFSRLYQAFGYHIFTLVFNTETSTNRGAHAKINSSMVTRSVDCLRIESLLQDNARHIVECSMNWEMFITWLMKVSANYAGNNPANLYSSHEACWRHGPHGTCLDLWTRALRYEQISKKY